MGVLYYFGGGAARRVGKSQFGVSRLRRSLPVAARLESTPGTRIPPAMQAIDKLV